MFGNGINMPLSYKRKGIAIFFSHFDSIIDKIIREVIIFTFSIFFSAKGY